MGAYCSADCVAAVLEELQQSMHSLLLALDALPEDADWFTADQRRLVAFADDDASIRRTTAACAETRAS